MRAGENDALYGLWSSEHRIWFWNRGGGVLFFTPDKRVALAAEITAMAEERLREKNSGVEGSTSWKIRTLGADGMPEPTEEGIG